MKKYKKLISKDLDNRTSGPQIIPAPKGKLRLSTVAESIKKSESKSPQRMQTWGKPIKQNYQIENRRIRLEKGENAFNRQRRETQQLQLNIVSNSLLNQIEVQQNQIQFEENRAIQIDALFEESIDCTEDSENRPCHPFLKKNSAPSKCIMIKSFDSVSEVTYKIENSVSKIGRHSSNDLVIFDESVSRFHAKITKREDEFYISDAGSTSGTYIKIDAPVELKVDMIIEIGSYQLVVTRIHLTQQVEWSQREDRSPSKRKSNFVEFEIYEAPDDIKYGKIRLRSDSSIGRNTSNMLSFKEDLHMSNLHCQVQLIGRCCQACVM